MKAGNHPKRKASATNQRSYLDWSSNMQIVHKRNGAIAMT